MDMIDESEGEVLSSAAVFINHYVLPPGHKYVVIILVLTSLVQPIFQFTVFRSDFVVLLYNEIVNVSVSKKILGNELSAPFPPI